MQRRGSARNETASNNRSDKNNTEDTHGNHVFTAKYGALSPSTHATLFSQTHRATMMHISACYTCSSFLTNAPERDICCSLLMGDRTGAKAAAES